MTCSWVRFIQRDSLLILALTLVGCGKTANTNGHAQMDVLMKVASSGNGPMSGNVAIFKAELAKGFDPNSLNAMDGKAEFTPLHAAAMNGYTAIVASLLDAGVKVDLRLDDGGTPLCGAVFGDSAETVNLLLEKGADPNVVWGKQLDQPHFSNKLWAAAVMKGNPEILGAILKHNQKLTNQDLEETVLVALDAPNGIEIVKALIANGYKPGSGQLVGMVVANKRKDVATLLLNAMDPQTGGMEKLRWCHDCKCVKCDPEFMTPQRSLRQR